MTLACEDDNSKLVDVVTIAVDDEDRIDNNLLQIWELRFGHKAQTRFGQNFGVGVQARV